MELGEIVPVLVTVRLLNKAPIDTELVAPETTPSGGDIPIALAVEDNIASDAIGINNANGLTEKRQGSDLFFIMLSPDCKELISNNYQLKKIYTRHSS
jgi:hypothetical protein